MGSLAKYVRDGDGNRYTPNTNGHITIEDVLAQADHENRLLQEATSGNISAEYKAILNEKYPGFQTAQAQDEVIAVNNQKFSYDLTSDMANLISFTTILNEWTYLPDFYIDFELFLYKNVNTQTRFTPTTDDELVNKVCLCNNFIQALFKCFKFYPNYQINNTTCSNNAIINRSYDRFKTMLVKKSYTKAFRESWINPSLGLTEETENANPITFAETKTLIQAADPNGLIRPLNGTPAPVAPGYQTALRDRYNAFMTAEKGCKFRVPLSLICEIFQMKEYFGKNKQVRFEFYIENDMNQLLEWVRPITDAQVTALANVGVAIKNPMIYCNTYRLKPSLPLEKSLYLNSKKDEMYTLLRIAHYEQVVTNVENVAEVTVNLGSIKTADLVPHSIIFSVTSKKESDHLSKGCFTPVEMACNMIKKITLYNYRRTYVNSAGDTTEYDLTKQDDQLFLWKSYVSLFKGNTPSTFNINNIADFYTADDDSFLRHPKLYFSSTNTTEPLVIDSTSDFNFINDKPPATIAGNNSFQINVQFTEQFKGVLVIFMQYQAQVIEQGSGNDTEVTYIPTKFKSS